MCGVEVEGEGKRGGKESLRVAEDLVSEPAALVQSVRNGRGHSPRGHPRGHPRGRPRG